MKYILLCMTLFLVAPVYSKTIEGSFLQIGENESTLEWNKKEWKKEFTYMRDIGMNKLIIQWTALSDGLGDASTIYVYYPNPTDPQFHTITQLGNKDILDTILSVCDSMGMEVYMGTLWKRGKFEYFETDTLNNYAKRNIELIHELYTKYYANNKHSSFAGWYIPEEFNNLVERGERFKEIAQISRYWKVITDTCEALSGKPVIISPYFDTRIWSDDSTTIWYEDRNSFRCWVDSLVKLSGIDILAIQDGIGSGRFPLDTVPPYFQIMKEQCDAHNVIDTNKISFWTDIENFKTVGTNTFIPADIETVLAQRDTEAPYVEKMVCFEFNHYMSLQTPASYPSQDSAKKLATKLYNDYRRDFGFMGHIMDTTVWDSGTYNIIGDLVIDSGVTLTICPDVTVYSIPDQDTGKSGKDTTKCELIVKGNLIANSAVFTSAGLTDWFGIRIDTGGTAEFRGCEIRNAKYGLYANGGSVLATNNLITSDSVGVYVNSNTNLVNLGNLRNGSTNDDGMNSIYNNTWNLYNAANDSVFAQANYWGDTLKMTGKVIYNPPGYDYNHADWTIANDTTIYGTFWNVSTFKINSGKTAKVATRAVNTTGWIAISADSIDIQGTFDADSAGYLAGEGPGAGTQGASSYGAGGAGFGGRGGHGGNNLQGDTSKYGGYAYGNLENSFDMGSGGGNSDVTLWGKGGAGGGVIRLKCLGGLNVAGIIRSNGKDGTGSDGKVAGGGSGGSILIQTNRLSGTGTISSKGGNGANGSTPDGGGGAGGRIQILYNNSSFTGRVDVSGGNGPNNAIDGQPGTAFVKQTDNYVRLVLSPVNTITNTDDKSGFINGVEFTDKWIRLTSGDTITSNIELKATDSIIVNSSSYLLADEKGYCHNHGTGYGHTGSASHGGGGAGYGNSGGYGNYHTQGGIGDSGITYGDTLTPDSLGSGGGDWGTTNGYRWGGGSGGGMVKLICWDGTGKILLNGTISASGSNGITKTGYAAGGGSGGSVLIYAKQFLGNGTINAKGGNGGVISNAYGGGGAGGRVRIYSDSISFSVGNISVSGGTASGGATAGHTGTINQAPLPSSGGPQGKEMEAPLVFRLYQNYPNPFINKTTIKYSIPRTSFVSLKLYDVTGRCVKTLIAGERLPGYYREKLESKNYPAGVYFAKFKAGDYKETKKLVLMK
ncbi:MAG: DUF4434 domain-containing protein [bacterium]|nr:DUF4434 domain-containing protein [bacterium]